LLIPVTRTLRRCVIACFQQWTLSEWPPVEVSRTTFLRIENSRRFQSNDLAKAGSARISGKHLRRSLSVKAFTRLPLKMIKCMFEAAFRKPVDWKTVTTCTWRLQYPAFIRA
jgi:hypothetical protein